MTLLRRSTPSPAGSKTYLQQAGIRRASKTGIHRVRSIGAISAVAVAAILGATVIPSSSAIAEPDSLHSTMSYSTASSSTPSSSTTSYSTASYSTAPYSTKSVVSTTAVFVAPRPTITGTHAVGQTLAANVAWIPMPDTFAFRWKRDGKPISKATHQTYKLTKSDAGRLLSVTVRGSKTGFTTVTKTSTAIRIQKVLTATPIPKISGTAAAGKTLKAIPGTWKPSGVKLHYAWIIDGIIVSTKSSFVVPVDILGLGTLSGKSISVYVTGSKSGYTSVTRMSLSKVIK